MEKDIPHEPNSDKGEAAILISDRAVFRVIEIYQG